MKQKKLQKCLCNIVFPEKIGGDFSQQLHLLNGLTSCKTPSLLSLAELLQGGRHKSRSMRYKEQSQMV